MEETILTGTITGITKKYSGVKTIFFFQLSGKSARTLDKGELTARYFRSALHPYMPAEIKGTETDGIFEVTDIKPIFGSPHQAAVYMAEKVKGSGVGKKRVKDIIEKYGEKIMTLEFQEFYDLLVNDFPRISVRTVESFLAHWYKENPISEIEKFMSQYDIKYSVISSMSDEYGADALSELQKDPYTVCLKYDISRDIAEDIARRSEIGAYDNVRIAGLVGYALRAAGKQGNTYMEAPLLAKRVNRYSLKSPYRTQIPPIFTANAISSKRSYILDKTKKYIAFRNLYNDEVNIAIKLKIIDQGIHEKYPIDDTMIKQAEKKLKLKFAKGQKKAFEILNSSGISILTGGPGTGKTTIVQGILTCYLNFCHDAKILLIAPTGRAAKKLSESTGYTAMTIHKALEFVPFRGEKPGRNAGNPLDTDLIVMDEASMCDTRTMSIFLNAVPIGCRVIFLGDENQLPSVGAGNCLHDMIASGKFNIWRLTENFRSDGTIIKNAERVLKGDLPEDAPDFEIIKEDDEEKAFNVLIDLMEKNYDKKNPFRCQMIEPSIKGALGTKEINSWVHRHIIQKSLKDDISDEIMAGDKIMFIRNEYNAGKDLDGFTIKEPLYVNGEIEIVKSVLDDIVVLWDGYDEKVLPRRVLEDAVFSYSFTIHKSQGSESETIIICLPDSVKGMMNKSLLYTAITRAKKKVILVYTGSALEDCLKDDNQIKRKTRLYERLVA